MTSASASDNQFRVELEEVDDEEFELHIKAYNQKQHTNFTGYDRKGPAVVYGYRHATIHGHFLDKEDELTAGTLIIFDWKFLCRDPKKRFKSAQIKVVFASLEGCSVWDEPAVYQMAPRGSYALLRTIYTEDKKKGVEASLKAQFGASVGLKVPYELSKSTQIGDKVRINGQPYLDFSKGPDRDPNRLNAVEWNFFENTSQKSGLPTHVRTAVLLSRETDDEFTASFTISAKVAAFVDIGASLKKLLGVLKDDPIAFVPGMKEKTDFDGHVNELHKVNLLDQCIFLMDNDVPGAKEEKKEDGKGEEKKEDGKGEDKKDNEPKVEVEVENEVDIEDDAE